MRKLDVCLVVACHVALTPRRSPVWLAIANLDAFRYLFRMVKPLTFAETIEARSAKRGPFRRFAGHRLALWLARHRHPLNLAIHLIGIPMAVTGVVLLFFHPWWGLGYVIGGYFLQYIGHQVEGNDVGEWAGIKKLLGLPYVGVSPRWEKPDLSAKPAGSSPT
jgi:hypothetical protein